MHRKTSDWSEMNPKKCLYDTASTLYKNLKKNATDICKIFNDIF